MRFVRRGFTLVEVSLFLALTGVLFVMIAVGVSNSVYQQRFNDSVQDFAEFFRRVYSGVENVQNNIGGGRSEKALYGKLVIFGAENDLTGNNNDKNAVFIYDVIGNIKKPSNSGLIEALKEVEASVFEDIEEGVGLNFAGRVESYLPRWGATVEKTGSDDEVVGAMLIVRHPRSGTINTLAYEGTGFNKLNDSLEYHREDILENMLDKFEIKEVNFCINLNETTSNMRRDVQIIRNASNASGINIIASENNPCAY